MLKIVWNAFDAAVYLDCTIVLISIRCIDRCYYNESRVAGERFIRLDRNDAGNLFKVIK